MNISTDYIQPVLPKPIKIGGSIMNTRHNSNLKNKSNISLGIQDNHNEYSYITQKGNHLSSMQLGNGQPSGKNQQRQMHKIADLQSRILASTRGNRSENQERIRTGGFARIGSFTVLK